MNDTQEKIPFNHDDAIKSIGIVHEYFVKRYDNLQGEDVRDLERQNSELDKVRQFLEGLKAEGVAKGAAEVPTSQQS